MKYYLGVDPGWLNLAYAWLAEDGSLSTGCVEPKTLSKGVLAPMEIQDAWCDAIIYNEHEGCVCAGAAMERFVYYDGVHNPNSEQILMVTGQMQFWLAAEADTVATMFKAFDWKSRLSKHIYKQGFRNPSDRLDKVFSIAAAEHLFPEYDFKTDHEADAACMAYIARMLDR